MALLRFLPYGESIQSFYIKCDVSHRFFIFSLYQVEEKIQSGIKFFQNFFFVCWGIHMVFLFSLLIWVILIGFSNVKPTLHSWGKPHLVIICYLFLIYFVRFYLLIILPLCPLGILPCGFLLLSYTWFWYMGNVNPHRMSWKVCPVL